MTPRVGFVGLGQLGAPMADRLVGWPGGLTVYDAQATAMAPFASTGTRLVGNLAELAAEADLISVMVRDDDQVTEVTREIAAAPRRAGTIVAIHSTIRAQTAPALAAELAPTGVTVIDAPVSGGAVGAQQGRLAVMVGGPPEAFERCREPFSRFADLVMHLGDVGAGTKAKLARNLLHFVSFTAAAEAQRLAEAAGLDLRKLGQIVRHSDAVTGGPGAIMLRSTTAPLTFDDPLLPILTHVKALADKDLALALQLGADLGLDLPLARIALAEFGVGLGIEADAGG